jgi:hypothetical protein
VWLLQPLLWLGPQRPLPPPPPPPTPLLLLLLLLPPPPLLLLPLPQPPPLLLPLLLLWLLSFLSRWLQLLWNICSAVYLTATATTHQIVHNEPEAFQPFNGPNNAQL